MSDDPLPEGSPFPAALDAEDPEDGGSDSEVESAGADSGELPADDGPQPDQPR